MRDEIEKQQRAELQAYTGGHSLTVPKNALIVKSRMAVSGHKWLIDPLDRRSRSYALFPAEDRDQDAKYGA